MMDKWRKVTFAGAKVLEIICWAAAFTFVLMLIICFSMEKFVFSYIMSGELAKIGAAELDGSWIVDAAGNFHWSAYVLTYIESVIVLCMHAFVFRNVGLIVKISQGKTKYTEGETPFQKGIILRLKKIGILLISAELLHFVTGLVIRFLLGMEGAEPGFDMGTLLVGAIAFCLAQCFSYGEEMQKDVEGLV